MRLPQPRGELTEQLVSALRADPAALTRPVVRVDDPLRDEDVQLALWIGYELHYRGFDDVADDAEWCPEVIDFRTVVEAAFDDALRRAVPSAPGSGDIAAALTEVVNADDGPSVSGYLQRSATREEFDEFVIHRSIYHLKEADPHSWAIPRLGGRPKAALVEIQSDEYGGGSLNRMHSELFRTTMRELGLDDSYGAYLDDVPGVTLATSNVISLFGLHRARRGALVGHLAAFEMTSSQPNRRYSQGLRRLGGSPEATRFYDEHVVADAVHEQLAAHDLCASLVAQEPDLASDVLFGASACVYVERLFAEYVLGCWQAGQSSLRRGVGVFYAERTGA